MKTVIINVTQKDIDKATEYAQSITFHKPRSRCCPIALAAQRRFRNPNLTVNGNRIGDIVNGNRVCLSTNEMAEFIKWFDDPMKRNQCKPHRFKVEVIDGTPLP